MQEFKPEIVMWDLGKFRFYDNNNKIHTDEQVSRIAKSMQAFGTVQPVAVDAEGVLIAGTGRIMAARKLGLKQYPAMVLTHLSPEQVRAYRIADNATTRTKFDDLSDFDMDSMVFELQSLQEMGADLSLTGIPSGSIDDFLASGVPDLDEAPEPPFVPENDADEEGVDIRIKRVDPETFSRWTSLMTTAPGQNPVQKLSALLACVDTAALAEYQPE